MVLVHRTYTLCLCPELAVTGPRFCGVLASMFVYSCMLYSYVTFVVLLIFSYCLSYCFGES